MHCLYDKHSIISAGVDYDIVPPGSPPSPSATSVLAVRYGTLRTTKSHLFYRYESYGERDVAQRMDYFFWIVYTPARLIVVDTGFHPDVGTRRGRTCLVRPGEALRRLGIDPGSVTDVIITHCHYDHIGNLALFPSAEVVIAEQELTFWTSRWARYRQFWEHVEEGELDTLVAAYHEGRLRTIATETELMPGVRLTPVGGHCPGQLIVSVGTPRRPVVLASDAVHLYEELELDRPFSVFSDLQQMYRTFALLKSMATVSGAIVVPGHDPDVAKRFPSVTTSAFSSSHDGSDLAADLAFRLD